MIKIDKERGKLHEKRKVARKEESCRIRGKLQDKRKVARYEESCKINREDDRQTIRSTRSRFSCLISFLLMLDFILVSRLCWNIIFWQVVQCLRWMKVRLLNSHLELSALYLWWFVALNSVETQSLHSIK